MLLIFLAAVALVALFAFRRLQKSDVQPRLLPMLARAQQEERPMWALMLGTLAMAGFGFILLFVIVLMVLAITPPPGQ